MVLTASSSGRSSGCPGLVVVQVQAVEAPVAVAAPGVERAVVAGLLDRVEDVAELDHVAAPAAVADVDARPRHVVERAVPDGDALRQCRSRRRPSASPPGRCDGSGSRPPGSRPDSCRSSARACGPESPGVCELVVPVAGHAGRIAIADEGHAVGPGVGDLAAADGQPAVVVVDEDGVAAHLVEEAVLQRGSPRCRAEDRAAAVDGPVAADQRLLGCP